MSDYKQTTNQKNRPFGLLVCGALGRYLVCGLTVKERHLHAAEGIGEKEHRLWQMILDEVHETSFANLHSERKQANAIAKSQRSLIANLCISDSDSANPSMLCREGCMVNVGRAGHAVFRVSDKESPSEGGRRVSIKI